MSVNLNEERAHVNLNGRTQVVLGNIIFKINFFYFLSQNVKKETCSIVNNVYISISVISERIIVNTETTGTEECSPSAYCQ